MLRRVVKLGLLAAALGVLYLAVTFVQVWQASRQDQAREAQAIVVFGAAQYNGRPSPVLRARLDHAVDLYERGLAGTIVVTGGRQPDDTSGYTEARASAEYLIAKDIPDDDILREVSSRDSWQSLATAASFLSKRGISRVILVSDGFHALRVRSMADELGLTAWTSPAPGSPIQGMGKVRYVVRETFAVAAGRVIGFRRVSGINRVREAALFWKASVREAALIR